MAGTIVRSFRILLRAYSIVFITIPVFAPLPYVPGHVIETPGIGEFFPPGMGALPVVLRIPAVSSVNCIAPEVYRMCSCFAGILPFRFIGKSGFDSITVAEFPAEFLCPLPCNKINGKIVTFVETGIYSHNREKLFLVYFIFTHPERT